MAFAADPDTEAPTVAKSFSTVTYTGTEATKSITGLGFKPGLVFLKFRNNPSTYISRVIDSVRGVTKEIYAESTLAENTETAGVLSLDEDGFTLGTNPAYNMSGRNFVAWAWKADDNEPTINTEGSIDSLVSANANAGFSIVKYTGNNTGSNQTIGHGLSATPEIIILKALDRAADWAVIAPNAGVGPGNFLQLNSTAAASGSGSIFGYPNNIGVSPTSTVFTVGGSNDSNATGENYIAYCFHSVAGYSKIGSYAGNGTSQTVTLGFRPDFVMLRKRDDTQDWFILDSVRGDTQPFDARLKANTTDAETTSDTNIYATDTGLNFPTAFFNDSGKNFIYMAFKIN